MVEEEKNSGDTSLTIDNKKKHKKLKKVFIILGCIIVLLFTLTYLIFLISHKDSSRNPTVKKETTNIQLIQKDLIEGFKNTKDTGRFSFRMSDEDINQILLNSTEGLLSGKEESCYIDSKVSTFYVDYKSTLGVKTRVSYVFDNYGINPSKEHVLIPTQVPRMGMLPYMWGHRMNFESFINEVSKKSGLPIRWENAMLIVSPNKLFEYFPNENIKSFVNGLISAKPECVSIDPNSLFGFDIDFSLFRGSNIPGKDISDTLPNLYSQVNDSLTPEFLGSISSGESKKACSISVADINKLIYSKFSKRVIEQASIDLTDVDVTLKVDDLYVSLIDTSHLAILMPVSINGYNLYFVNNSIITTFPKTMVVNFEILTKVMLNNVEFPKEGYVGNVVISSLLESLNDICKDISYMNFKSDSNTLSLDLSNIEKTNPDFTFYNGTISTNVVDPKGFDVIVTAQ
ncbi:MAG: hypothetical protein KBS97_03015 [Firmicutes bacterium]|nr:hypothetical protein [Candidatus Fiminaster equi]